MRRHHFNMIEILLALGVIAIGAISVLALFPYGLSSNRDSIAESFAGDSADQFLHWFAAQARSNWTGYALNASWLPAAKPSVPTAAPYMESGGWGAQQDVTENLKYERHSSDSGVLRVTMQRGDTSGEIIEDFSGVYRLWKDPVFMEYLDSGGSSTKPLDTNSAVAINLEASWPAALPYNRRQKKTYRLEVFRPSPTN